ncbi:lytic transglycosylase domain-containing protein [Planosporangium sp. 12N6]|uniref:lytic transglycosylase domain-containing protein n=1 Tax=Planosporangium spinosum TaxID=3402278 RepID=UPI003CF73E19
MGQGDGVAEPMTLRPAAPTEVTDPPAAADGTGDVIEATGGPARRSGHRWARPAIRLGALASRLGAGARAAGRAAVGWSRRRYGRVVAHGLVIFAVLGASLAAGAYVVPVWPTSTQRAFATLAPAADGVPGGGSDLPGVDPSGGAGAGPGTPTRAPDAVTKPSDLAAWARPLATRLGIPQVAMQAYGYAELATAISQPTCQLRWTTLAGIGKVESAHGQHKTTLAADGTALPPILGDPLDGQGGRMAIHDTDNGRLDGDRIWDRAVGPMQFIPSTWASYQADADGDGVADINNINDAALTAARYLCAGNRNLSVAGDWWAAIMSYNAVQAYVQDVFAAANDYGVRSR